MRSSKSVSRRRQASSLSALLAHTLSEMIARLSILLAVCASCHSTPKPKAGASPAANASEPSTASTQPEEASASSAVGEEPRAVWKPRAQGTNTALVLRFGRSVLTMACVARGRFHVGESCHAQTGDLAEVTMSDMGKTPIGRRKKVLFEAGESEMMMYPLSALSHPPASELNTGYAEPGPLDGIGVWPAGESSALIVTRAGERELMTALSGLCESEPKWPSCRYLKELPAAAPSLSSEERAALEAATESLRGGLPLIALTIADVQLDEDSALERVYNIYIKDRHHPGAHDEDQHLADWILLVRDGDFMSEPLEQLVIAATDLDGNGRVELFLMSNYYEGVNYTLSEWREGRWKSLAAFTNGA